MPLRILDEAEFWKLQEKEHTVVIREAFGNLETEYVDALAMWEQALGTTHQNVISFIETVIRIPHIPAQLYQQVVQLVTFCLNESLKFIELCRQIKTNSAAVKNNPIAQTILDHIIRESEYFIGIARVILYGNVHQSDGNVRQHGNMLPYDHAHPYRTVHPFDGMHQYGQAHSYGQN